MGSMEDIGYTCYDEVQEIKQISSVFNSSVEFYITLSPDAPVNFQNHIIPAIRETWNIDVEEAMYCTYGTS